MKDRIWIVFDRRQVVRMHKTNKFTLQRGEKYCCVDIDCADSVFDPPPELMAKLVLQDNGVTGAHSVTIDPAQIPSGDDGARSVFDMMAAKLFEKAINSDDESLRDMAIEALAECKKAGVEVRIQIPEVPNA